MISQIDKHLNIFQIGLKNARLMPTKAPLSCWLAISVCFILKLEPNSFVLIEPSLSLIILGDAAETHREVEFDEGKTFAEQNELLFFEASAKTSENVDEACLIILSD
jgi:hypothetical protein